MAFDPITAIANTVNTVLGRVLPDKPAQEAAQAQLAQMALSGELAQMAGQIQTNVAEAASKSTFVAGWRPYIGWICGTGLGYEMLLRPLLTFAAGLFGSHVVAPEIPMQDLSTILMGMLGLATMRTVEKVKGMNAGA